MKKFGIVLFVVAAIVGISYFDTDRSTNSAAIFTLPTWTDSNATPAESRPVYNLRDFNNAISAIAEESNPAVVTIMTMQKVKYRVVNPFEQFFGGGGNGRGQEREQVRSGLGSGVIVSKDGYILTNNHVVDQADSISVYMIDDEEYDVDVIGTDARTDIAVLKIKDAENKKFDYLELGDSEALRVGEMVIAIGSPLDPGLAHTVTMGIVSAKGRAAGPVTVRDEQSGQRYAIPALSEYIQTDAAINPGNSGGALIDMNGKLVGINSAIASQTGGFQGIGFAVPVKTAKSVMESLIENGKVIRGYLGIIPKELDSKLAKALGLERKGGVLIDQVAEDTPAEEYGLKNGDVITHIDDKRVRNVSQFRVWIAGFAPDSKVKLSVLRDGKEKEITVKLGVLEDELSPGTGSGTSSDSSNENIFVKQGFKVSDLDSQLAERYEIPKDVEKGALVTAIQRGSKAAESLEAGDIVVKVGDENIENTNDLEKALTDYSKEGKDVILVRVIRQGRATFVALELNK